MTFISKNFNILRAAKQKILVRTFLKKHAKFQVSSFKFISFNGRTLSFSFVDRKTGKKFFLKKFLYQDNGFENLSFSVLLDKKYDLVNKLTSAKLLSYSTYKLNNSGDIYIRDYVSGVTLLEYFMFLNASDFEQKSKQVIKYLQEVFIQMRKYKFFVSVDLHLNNIIVLNNGKIDLIDLDLVYIKVEEGSF